jgi:AcrR family transcriptional regulator
MPEVNRRPYRSPKRAQQAAATRAAILDAAAELFDAKGYTQTTTAAVARHAGVSEAMVFAAFASKAGLLQALINRAVVPEGDSADALAATSTWTEAAEASDAPTALSRFAAMAATIQQRTWKLIDLSRTASDADPAMASLLAEGAANRRTDCRAFVVAALAPHLGDRVSVDEAADILWAYTSADLYRLLVHDAGWAHARYVDWLTEALATALLHPGPARRRR